MIKTIRLAAIVLVVCAASALVLAIVLGLRPDQEKLKILAQKGIVEQFRSKASTSVKPKTTPLMAQAELTAKRFNPPPKPKPVDPDNPGAPGSSAKNYAPPPPPPPQFEVVATCFNPQEPQKSYALLNQPGKGFFWVKSGDEVSRASIKQVLAGKIVTSDGKEYAVPVVQKVNLLKPGSAMPAGYEKNTLSVSSASASPALAAKFGAAGGTRLTTAAMAVEKSPAMGSQTSSAEQASYEPTAEEKKATADFLKQVMADPEAMGVTKEEAAQLGDLGQYLKDINGVDTAPKAADPNSRGQE
jgi:hypothetical protein